MMDEKAARLRVAILDDHQSILDGYLFRLNQNPEIEVVGTAAHAEGLEQVLAKNRPDVLILDAVAPTSADNPNPYPILEAIPRWLQVYPHISILIISMYDIRALVRAVMEAGASGYILKNDQAAIRELGSIVRSIASGGIYFSRQLHKHLHKPIEEDRLLTARQLQALSVSAAFPDASTDELAGRLGVANSTVRNLLSGAYLRLEVHNRAAAIAKARHLGLIPPQDLAKESN